MELSANEDKGKFRSFLEKAGILFPKGFRAASDRRSGADRRSGDPTSYFSGGGEDRRDYVEMRQNRDRRRKKTEPSPLDGML